MLAWLSVWSEVQTCIILHMAQLMPLPLNVSCFRSIQIGFTFLVPAHPGSPGQKTVKNVCVLVIISHLLSRHTLLAMSRIKPQCSQEDAFLHTLEGPVVRSTCVSWHHQFKMRDFVGAIFYRPLLTATRTFGLERRCQSSPQQCYLHCLHTTVSHEKTLKIIYVQKSRPPILSR